jgi:hypothetical protein
LTSTFLAPPSPSKLPANIAISAETNRAQIELLQLHLLHRDAATIDTAWRSSAKQKLGDRFAALGRASAALSAKEAEQTESTNVLALRSWGSGGGMGLEERIQALDSVLSGVWSLDEPGGRYARVLRRFERWAERMCEVEEARARGDGPGMLDGEGVAFVGELDAAWKADCAALARKLEGWGRQLQELGEVPGEEEVQTSSLGVILSRCRALARDRLAELSVMDRIERDAVRREGEWIQRMNMDDGDDTPRAGAIWRAL